ncbi:kinase-like domain-containing protein [Sporodiniella umbellata]|nr:kinase-like domain-containing protein [Sporodiniella umbellata]
MAGKLKDKSPGLKLDLNTPLSEEEQDVTWREDIARLVQHNEDDSDVKPKDLEPIQRLGEGAAGTVWKVLYKPLKKIMAKKTMTVDIDPQKQRQVLRELSFLKTCESPYIVAFYGAFLEETMVSICMEYCEGGSLEDIYKKANQLQGVIGETILANVAEAVCRGLIYLHSKNVIHRDVKPSNILMTREGKIKLCDLGVSGELIDSLAQTFTGTQYYMAPERIQGGSYTVRSDIWSLGLTIIEVAEQRPALPPPDQPNLTIFELLDIIIHQPMPNCSKRSVECQDFVSTCLIKAPDSRPTPEEMLEHEFIKKRADPNCDMEGWLKELWGWQ